MAKYMVIHKFRDLQDGDHIYNVGNKYPRKGRSKKDRIDELLSCENKVGVPLIAEVGEENE